MTPHPHCLNAYGNTKTQLIRLLLIRPPTCRFCSQLELESLMMNQKIILVSVAAGVLLIGVLFVGYWLGQRTERQKRGELI